MKNRFNNIDSKEWLPFQKSWFVYSNLEKLYRSNIRFFTQINDENPKPNVLYSGNEKELALGILKDEERRLATNDESNIMFAMLDLVGEIKNLNNYQKQRDNIIEKCIEIFGKLQHRKFLCIWIENIENESSFSPIAWDLALSLSDYFSLKDEKIACIQNGDKLEGNRVFYALYFRKDEKSKKIKPRKITALAQNFNLDSKRAFALKWQVVRPRRRKKNEILHPAKYPEELTGKLIENFTSKGANVFDPMSGTGSTQVSALGKERNAYGTELSEFFWDIAQERCKEMQFGSNLRFQLKLADAKKIRKSDFPPIDYLLTSPPYWDMLNMKGAEYQARRKEKGLQLNYSDHPNDLGNVEDYEEFLNSLVDVYKKCDKLLKEKAHITIVVKNIKKKGSNYPFAWQLTQKLIKIGWEPQPSFFWCQDDINIAPYGYGNTWVSNTFHQYCLNFQKR